MTMLPNIEEAMEDARNGKLSPYWQNDLKRECLHRKLSDEERQALSELNRILSETPQWSGEEELCIEMENIGGRVCFCHFWDEHYSMVQLTEDRNGNTPQPMFWMQKLPRMCVRWRHCRHRKNLRTVCRCGAFRFWMRLFLNR